MTVSPLSILLGIVIGAGGVYLYFIKKSRGLVKGAQKFIDKNIDKFTDTIQTLKSEGTDQPKKVEGIPRDDKEDPVMVPTSTPLVPVEKNGEE